MSTRDITHIAFFTALLAVMAQISIPMPLGVPITMQTFAVILAGITLGAKKGALSTIAYLLLGIFGVPAFASFRGGAEVLLGATGGFLLSFPIMAFLCGLGIKRKTRGENSSIYKKKRIARLVAGITAGTAANFMCGMFFFVLMTHSAPLTAFYGCVLPFLPGAVIKAVLAAPLGLRLNKLIAKRSNSNLIK